jgi:BirA family biotin operon repressor/biotin-[acetyl-CoA-carboxylase] ligase
VIARPLPFDARLLKLLRTGGAIPHSALVATLEIDWPIIAARIEGLRAAGYRIAETPGTVRLIAAPDRLVADDLLGLLEDVSYIREILVFEETGSTNDVALQLARCGAGGGLIVFAERQLAGRGRLGRRWDSQSHEGLWFSLLLRPDLPLAQWPHLTTWAAVAVAEAIDQFLPVRAQIKWPNDILVRGRKAVGILTESSLEAGAPYAVVGIGVNVNQTAFPPEIAERATSLRLATGAPLDRTLLAAAILRNLGAWLPALTEDFVKIVEAASGRSALLGQKVRCLSGGKLIEGIATGLASDGALEIRTEAGGAIRLSAGEVIMGGLP